MTDSATVLITVDFDGPSSWINVHGNLPGTTSRGEFSTIGISRLLQTFDQYGVIATFFVPGHTAVTYPDLIRQIVERGHEIGHHGWMHESPITLPRAEERAVVQRGIEAIASVTDQQPLGYRAPGWELSCHTVELLLEAGFEYDSSQMANDYVPYWCRVGDQHDPDGPYRFGSAVPLVEIPVSWHLDDGPHFEYVYGRDHQLVNPGLRSGRDVEAIWLDEWTYLTERAGGGAFILTLHPEVIGRGYRMLMLERVLDHITSAKYVRFMRCLDFCREWKMTEPAPSPHATHDSGRHD
jgi:peptidoglycan/xylan/chitin deacetylase (PgdA/CDA1 family)